MKLTDNNIIKIINDIELVLEDVLLVEPIMFDELKLRNSITLYNTVAFKINSIVTVYVELNKAMNDITIWIGHKDDIEVFSHACLEVYRQKSVPAWVVGQMFKYSSQSF